MKLRSKRIIYVDVDGTICQNRDDLLDVDSTTTYELEYDSKDNWIKKITYEDDKPTDITEREIEYYD